MIAIRKFVFETNSSNTHSLTLCNEEDFKKWENGEVLLIVDYPYDLKDKELRNYCSNNNFISIENAKKVYDMAPFYWNFTDMFQTCEEFFEDDWLDVYEEHTSIDGIDVVAFGKYGRDG